ncbi:acyl-CoA dehydrogenase family protein [Allomesorhizobium camelthorni]|uniref:acyl-CoA dehydrogenase family protein n=1 Tax=Allomesorhizobium camelthorni TaxID=475069 RepID=UPI003CCCD744
MVRQLSASPSSRPRSVDVHLNEATDPSIFRELVMAVLLGVTIPVEYDRLGAGYAAYASWRAGLSESTAVTTMMSVQSSLIMYLCWTYPCHSCGGADEQRFHCLFVCGTGWVEVCGALQIRARHHLDAVV